MARSDDVARGVEKVAEREGTGKLLFFEVGLISLGSGVALGIAIQQWVVGVVVTLVVFLGMYQMLRYRELYIWFARIMSIIWGLIPAWIAYGITSEAAGQSAIEAAIMAVVAFVVVGGTVYAVHTRIIPNPGKK